MTTDGATRTTMRAIIFLSSILTVYAGVTKDDCSGGVIINGIYNDLEVLHNDLNIPYLLAVDHSTNILYFSYTVTEINGEKSKTARINLDTKEFKAITGVKNGFAQTVNQVTHEIYIGGSDGIYKYDYGTDKAQFVGLKDTNIWNIYFRDVLYYIVYPWQILFTFDGNQSQRFKDLEDTKVDNFVIDKNDTIFFTNATGLYSQEKGTKNATFYKDFPNIGVRAMAVDANGKVYVCLKEGIFAVNKEKVTLESVIDDNAFGLTFDNDNHFIYSNFSSLIRLKPNRSKSC